MTNLGDPVVVLVEGRIEPATLRRLIGEGEPLP
jgi:hypothetical protein